MMLNFGMSCLLVGLVFLLGLIGNSVLMEILAWVGSPAFIFGAILSNGFSLVGWFMEPSVIIAMVGYYFLVITMLRNKKRTATSKVVIVAIALGLNSGFYYLLKYSEFGP